MTRFSAFILAFLIAATAFGDTASDQFNAAKQAFDAQQYTQSRAAFETFLATYSNTAQAADATLYLAESYLNLRQYDQAAQRYAQLINLGLDKPQARVAMFRLGDIPYVQERFDIAKPRLEEFIEKLPHDIHNQFALYYLGDIAMRSNIPPEAEFYFSQCLQLFPQGARASECQIGLAWAKNQLNKTMEADELFRQLSSNPNPAVAEPAIYQWGVAQYERGAYQEAVGTLTNFLNRWPQSVYVPDAKRALARCKADVGDFNGAIQIISQIATPNAEDMLLRVKCLYGLKQTKDAQTLLTSVERMNDPTVQDEISLLKGMLYSDQQNWKRVISTLEPMLSPQYNPSPSPRLVFNYFTIPAPPNGRKLNEESFLKACSLLTLAYANNGDTAKANAALAEMTGYAGMTGGPKLQSLVADTSSQLAGIGSGASYPGGSQQPFNPNNPTFPGNLPTDPNSWGNYPGNQGNPNNPNNQYPGGQASNGSRPGRPGNNGNNNGNWGNGGNDFGNNTNPNWGQNSGLNPGQFPNQNQGQFPNRNNGPNSGQYANTPSEMDRFREATTQYDRQNWSGAAQILEQLLNTQYNSWGKKQFYINYTSGAGQGALDETTFFRACSLLTLTYAHLGDQDRAKAAATAMAGMIRPSDMNQQAFLKQTLDQLADIVQGKGGTTPGYPAQANPLNPNSPNGSTPTDLLSDAEQRRILQECNSLYKIKRFDTLEPKLADLMNRTATPSVKAEAALLRARVSLERNKDRDALNMLELVVGDSELSKTDQCSDALWLLGLYYESCGDTSKGVEYCQRLVDEFPNNKNVDGALYFLAWDDIENNGGRRANSYLTRVYRNYQNGKYWSHATWTLAYLAYKKKEFAQAETYVQKVLQHPPDYAILDRVLYLKGELSLQRKEFDTAAVAFREVARLCPDSPLRDTADKNAMLAARNVKIN